MTDTQPLVRKAGRPRKAPGANNGLPLISKQMVIERAYELCDTVRLEDLTIELVSRELNVSPTTIRHHTKTRSALTSALIERYFKDLKQRMPILVGDWKVDLENYLRAYMVMCLKKRGFVSYLFEHRFAPELTPFISSDAYVAHLHVLKILNAAGLNTVDAALAWHLIIHLLGSIAYAETRGQTPSEQDSLFETISRVGERPDPDRAVLAALRYVNLPLIFSVISSMLQNALEVKFIFPNAGATAVRHNE